MLKEFKEFATKGNVVDLAVGVVIGGAFQKIVTSLVEDIIMPCVSILTGRIDFSDMVLTVGDASIKYGNFITTIVNFLIISFSIFLVVRYVNKLNKLKDVNEKLIHKIDKNGKFIKAKNESEEHVVVEPETKICPFCLSEVKFKATRCPHCTSDLSVSCDSEENSDSENTNKESV